jgi:serine/threonine protein kinase
MKGDFQDPDSTIFSKETRLLIRSMLNQLPDHRPSIHQILRAPFLQKAIAAVVLKYPFLESLSDYRSTEEVGFLSPLNSQGQSVLLGSVQIASMKSLFHENMHSSNQELASTLKYVDEEEEIHYSADFEEYEEDEEVVSSDPDGIHNYISSQIGCEKTDRLFRMIQRRVDNQTDSDDFKAEAQEILGADTDKLLPLAEAAVYLQNALSLSLN